MPEILLLSKSEAAFETFLGAERRIETNGSQLGMKRERERERDAEDKFYQSLVILNHHNRQTLNHLWRRHHRRRRRHRHRPMENRKRKKQNFYQHICF